MIIKFNKLERAAGIFVLSALVGSVTLSIGVAFKRGWFDAKRSLVTQLESADGIHVGTQVQMSGLRIGSVDDIELKSKNMVEVHFEISEKYFMRVRETSVVQLMRPFIIGEKVLDISTPDEDSPRVVEGALIKAQDSVDFMDLLSGRKLGPYLSSMGKISENLKVVAETILDQKHLDACSKVELNQENRLGTQVWISANR